MKILLKHLDVKNEYSNFKLADRVKDKKDIFFKTFDEFYFKKKRKSKKTLSIPEKIEKLNDNDFIQISPMNSQGIRDEQIFIVDI